MGVPQFGNVEGGLAGALPWAGAGNPEAEPVPVLPCTAGAGPSGGNSRPAGGGGTGSGAPFFVCEPVGEFASGGAAFGELGHVSAVETGRAQVGVVEHLARVLRRRGRGDGRANRRYI